MSEGIKLVMNENGEFEKCDDTYDLVFHCESEEEQETVKKIFLNADKMRWIPITERLPEDESYILVSFENTTMPDIARYEEDGEGGTFYPGDDEDPYTRYGIFVNAWMPLPEPYKKNDDEGQADT